MPAATVTVTFRGGATLKRRLATINSQRMEQAVREAHQAMAERIRALALRELISHGLKADRAESRRDSPRGLRAAMKDPNIFKPTYSWFRGFELNPAAFAEHGAGDYWRVIERGGGLAIGTRIPGWLLDLKGDFVSGVNVQDREQPKPRITTAQASQEFTRLRNAGASSAHFAKFRAEIASRNAAHEHFKNNPAPGGGRAIPNWRSIPGAAMREGRGLPSGASGVRPGGPGFRIKHQVRATRFLRAGINRFKREESVVSFYREAFARAGIELPLSNQALRGLRHSAGNTLTRDLVL